MCPFVHRGTLVDNYLYLKKFGQKLTMLVHWLAVSYRNYRFRFKVRYKVRYDTSKLLSVCNILYVIKIYGSLTVWQINNVIFGVLEKAIWCPNGACLEVELRFVINYWAQKDTWQFNFETTKVVSLRPPWQIMPLSLKKHFLLTLEWPTLICVALYPGKAAATFQGKTQ